MVICLAARRIWTHGMGGMETHSQMLTRELVRQGHTVHVVTTAHPSGRQEETQMGAQVHYLPKTPPGDYSRAWWHASHRWGQQHFDPLGVQAILSMSMAGKSMARVAHAPPLFLIVHGHGWSQLKSFWHNSRGWRKLVEFPRDAAQVLFRILWTRSVLRRAVGVLGVSRELCEQLKHYRPHFAPNVVDTSQFRPDATSRAETRATLGIAEADVVALMVGTVNWQKGVDLGLRACAEVALTIPGFCAVVIGDGPALNALTHWQRTEARHLPVHFLGPRSYAELPRYYAAADIFLFPSRRQEGLPTVVLEAMAAGLPIVATRSGGTPTAVRDGETGLLTSISDCQAFTAALHSLAGNPARRRAFGIAARRSATEAFDVGVVVERLVKIMGSARC